MAGQYWARSKRQQANSAMQTVAVGLLPAADSHAHARERVLARLDAASYMAQTAGQFSSMIQAEVKIGEHLGMWSQQGRSDEVTLALVDALRQAVVGRDAPRTLPTIIEHTEPTVNSTRARGGGVGWASEDAANENSSNS